MELFFFLDKCGSTLYCRGEHGPLREQLLLECQGRYAIRGDSESSPVCHTDFAGPIQQNLEALNQAKLELVQGIAGQQQLQVVIFQQA